MTRNSQFIAALTVVSSLATARVNAQAPTELASQSSAGLQGDTATSAQLGISLSDDGRFVAFASAATTLDPGDVNGMIDVFVRDRLLGTTELVSVSTGGTQGDAASTNPSLSDDGRFVAFDSGAANLVAGDTNGFADVFVRDRLNGTTVRISVPQAGGEGNGFSSVPSISGDGRFVSFVSAATNLVAGDTNANPDIFVSELATGVIVRASVGSGGLQGNSDSYQSALSDDGSTIAFVSRSSNLCANDVNATFDVFLRDLVAGTTTLASPAPGGGTPSSGAGGSLAFSGDGQFVAFTSGSSDLGIPQFTNEIFVFERATGTLSIASKSYMGVNSGGGFTRMAVSDDGRMLVFSTNSQKLVNLDFGPNDDVFLVDRANGEVTRASMSVIGTGGTGASVYPTISGDGRWIAFSSYAYDMVNADGNGVQDVFVHDRTQTQPVAFCAGKVSGQGCHPIIASNGLPSLSQASGFTIEGLSIKRNVPGLLFYGSTPSKAPFMGGTLCVTPPLKRCNVLFAGGSTNCTGHFTLDFNAWIAGGHAPSVAAGDVVYAQYWYRDSLSAPFFVGFTDALRFVVYP
ncbi:MAG: hypothetical protein K8S98_10855 [Planctomycetes bacterium]|nr:hypothetical protein [Planctomycetota bacterium]